jgi:hypothetical protein
MDLKEPVWWIENNYFEALFPSFTSETALIYDMCTDILIRFTQFYLKKLPVNEFFSKCFARYVEK